MMIRRDIGAIMRSQSAVLVNAALIIPLCCFVAFLLWGWIGVLLTLAGFGVLVLVLIGTAKFMWARMFGGRE
jgi:uncharacterized membrane protein